ncbi:DUF1893 domain-containing protein [uncultured Alistipes sp.]|jgi:tonB-dependent outer membrane receptor|uniref:DUF1893 domain-containing protein n=1 Tax=uncultured Alistipes sp. TaxID=538949 RepID=UPI0025F13283|nr:DUF1893 domain-containing protein [uncultured Alistipes sp.]
MTELIDMLHAGNYSCVIRNGETRTFSRRRVADLYLLLETEPGFLEGASVADKVVGKGAAAIMALGGIRDLYTDVISTPAIGVLTEAGIEVTFETEVAAIRNRAGDGFCPLESRCAGEDSPEGMLPIIRDFMRSMQSDTNNNK